MRASAIILGEQTRPRALSESSAGRPAEATINYHYFSTVRPDPFELASMPEAQPSQRVRTSRDSVRPLPLPQARPTSLENLYPPESLPGRIFAVWLTLLMVALWLPVVWTMRSTLPTTATLGSPTLDTAVRHLAAAVNSRWPDVCERLSALSRQTVRLQIERWMPEELPMTTVLAVSALAAGALGILDWRDDWLARLAGGWL